MRVLIIDDSPSILECTRALLESHGHEVMTWPEEVDGCQEVKNWFLAGFDVVICDGLGGEGQKFLIGVRRDYPKIKTILHSADSSSSSAWGRCGGWPRCWIR